MRTVCAGLVLWVVSCPLAIAEGGGATPSGEQQMIPAFRDCVIEKGSWSECTDALPDKSPLKSYAARRGDDSTENHSYEYLFDQSSYPFLKGGIWSKTSAELFLERRKLDRAWDSGYRSPPESLM